MLSQVSINQIFEGFLLNLLKELELNQKSLKKKKNCLFASYKLFLFSCIQLISHSVKLSTYYSSLHQVHPPIIFFALSLSIYLSFPFQAKKMSLKRVLILY
ncbi:hypothetical protein BY996DRAFT_7525756 [Phakopsora pachyrhizi]|nr:hypothetical protein BY996DRAFT_7525756 [Phakopsora pachyrhizi]